MLPKQHRLRHERDFAKLSIKGRPLYGPFCILRAWKSGSIPSKIGFVASGKMFKKAVTRNLIRRRMREAFRPFLPSIPNGYDLSFIGRPEVLTADFIALRESIGHLLEKMPKELERPMTRPPKSPRSRRGEIAYAKATGTQRPAKRSSLEPRYPEQTGGVGRS
jgi:ribonuclease P protein component